jgi:hypothetical protein
MRHDDVHEPTDDLLEIPGVGGGRELLRVAAEADGAYLLLSVPVCALGLSRGTRVAATRDDDGVLRLTRVLAPSPGATVRCTVSPTCTTGHFDEEFVREGAGPLLGLGPVSIVEPELVAVHVADRAQLPRVAAWLDRLILMGVLSTWTYGDPGELEDGRMALEPMASWELVHPPARDPDVTPGAGA